LPGRGFIEPADDVIAILDHLGLEKVHVIGGSGGAPHVLALAARHPDRVRVVTVLVGAWSRRRPPSSSVLTLNRTGLSTAATLKASTATWSS
jgi:pimeloyl-ACP methyl ester carboxylesterase